MLKSLEEFKIGEGVIKSVSRRTHPPQNVRYGRHSARIVLRKKAPLGDPLQITIRGYELTLRKAEAAYVMLEVN